MPARGLGVAGWGQAPAELCASGAKGMLLYFQTILQVPRMPPPPWTPLPSSWVCFLKGAYLQGQGEGKGCRLQGAGH